MVSIEQFERANERGRERRSGPTVVAARYDRVSDRVVLALSTGFEVAFPPRLAEGIERATAGELDTIEISPSGLGIHFPKIDADIYVPALLEGTMGSKTWSAARMGAIGGSSKSEAKATASRSNGARGGRPRKPKVSVT
jgi:hypothetical protein